MDRAHQSLIAFAAWGLDQWFRKPLEGIGPGPAHLRALFEQAKLEMRPVDRPEVAVRVLERGIAA